MGSRQRLPNFLQETFPLLHLPLCPLAYGREESFTGATQMPVQTLINECN